MFPCKADLAFYQSRHEPKWAQQISNAPFTSIDAVVNAHARINMLGGECAAHNLAVMLKPMIRAKAPAYALAARLTQLATEYEHPACRSIRNKRMAGFARKWAAMLTRTYHVIVKNERTGSKTRMTLTPVTHHEGCVILSKLRPHQDTRALLVQTKRRKR